MKVNVVDNSLPESKSFNSGFSSAFTLRWLVVFLLTGCLLITAFIRCRLIFFVSPDIGGIESNIIYSIQRYLAGYSLYTNPELTPYAITQYSPFYYRVVAAVSYWAGIGPDDLLTIYRISRSISLIANLMYSLILFGLSYRLYPNKKIGLIIAIIAFMILPPQAYSRPDSLYSMLVMATLYTNLRSIQSRQRVHEYCWLISSVGLASLAIATKQTGIVLVLLMVSYYAFFCRQWLKAIGIGMTTGLLSIVFLVSLMPEHDPFLLLYTNIVKGVNQGIDYSSFKVNIIDHYFRTFSLYNAAGIPLSIWLIQQTKPDFRWLGWCVIGLFGVSLMASLKWGSALNYFTEYVALSSIVVALWVDQWDFSSHLRTSNWILLLSGLCWAVLPNIPNFNWPLVLRSNALSKAPYYQQKQVADYLTDSLHLNGCDAIFITDYNYCYLNGLLFRNCIVPQQDMVGAIMYPQRKFDYKDLDWQIRHHGIRFLITRDDETATHFTKLSTDYFCFKHKIYSYSIYEDTLSRK